MGNLLSQNNNVTVAFDGMGVICFTMDGQKCIHLLPSPNMVPNRYSSKIESQPKVAFSNEFLVVIIVIQATT